MKHRVSVEGKTAMCSDFSEKVIAACLGTGVGLSFVSSGASSSVCWEVNARAAMHTALSSPSVAGCINLRVWGD